ncbi:MAG TPA: cytochrome C oxidase subunit IV family protein [Caulobacteraceae bacterium]|jgi:cytochrome c oxidase subunit 4
MARELRLAVLVWLGLMALLATTVAVTFSPLGPIKPTLNLAIAALKAGLVLWVFMHLREQSALNRLAALFAVAWLAILVAMTLIDLGTRGVAAT